MGEAAGEGGVTTASMMSPEAPTRQISVPKAQGGGRFALFPPPTHRAFGPRAPCILCRAFLGVQTPLGCRGGKGAHSEVPGLHTPTRPETRRLVIQEVQAKQLGWGHPRSVGYLEMV